MLNFVDLKKLQNLVISLAKCCFDTANNKPFKVCSERLTPYTYIFWNQFGFLFEVLFTAQLQHCSICQMTSTHHHPPRIRDFVYIKRLCLFSPLLPLHKFFFFARFSARMTSRVSTSGAQWSGTSKRDSTLFASDG